MFEIKTSLDNGKYIEIAVEKTTTLESIICNLLLLKQQTKKNLVIDKVSFLKRPRNNKDLVQIVFSRDENQILKTEK